MRMMLPPDEDAYRTRYLAASAELMRLATEGTTTSNKMANVKAGQSVMPQGQAEITYAMHEISREILESELTVK